jgi:hypothetical protein
VPASLWFRQAGRDYLGESRYHLPMATQANLSHSAPMAQKSNYCDLHIVAEG